MPGFFIAPATPCSVGNCEGIKGGHLSTDQDSRHKKKLTGFLLPAFPAVIPKEILAGHHVDGRVMHDEQRAANNDDD